MRLCTKVEIKNVGIGYVNSAYFPKILLYDYENDIEYTWYYQGSKSLDVYAGEKYLVTLTSTNAPNRFREIIASHVVLRAEIE